MTDEQRIWRMFGHQAKNGVWTAVGSEHFIEHHGYATPPVPVTVIEDPNGDYMGWFFLNNPRLANEPLLIQHRLTFNVQFGAGGYQAEEKAVKGKAIRLSITVRTISGELGAIDSEA